MFRLPVSGIPFEFRPITGAEDMLLLESSAGAVRTAVALAGSLAVRADGACLDAAALPMADLEALILELRRKIFGNEIRTRRVCTAPDCGERTEISLGITEYLAGHRPSTVRNVEPVEGSPGWFRLGAVEFRLVTAGDVLAVEGSPDAEARLRALSIRPEGAAAREVKRIQTAMESLSPCLAQELEGECPGCGSVTSFYFDPVQYVVQELQYEAAFLYHDVHVLAARYHWTEEKILALPRARRAQYAEFALDAGGVS